MTKRRRETMSPQQRLPRTNTACRHRRRKERLKGGGHAY